MVAFPWYCINVFNGISYLKLMKCDGPCHDIFALNGYKAAIVLPLMCSYIQFSYETFIMYSNIKSQYDMAKTYK